MKGKKTIYVIGALFIVFSILISLLFVVFPIIMPLLAYFSLIEVLKPLLTVGIIIIIFIILPQFFIGYYLLRLYPFARKCGIIFAVINALTFEILAVITISYGYCTGFPLIPAASIIAFFLFAYSYFYLSAYRSKELFSDKKMWVLTKIIMIGGIVFNSVLIGLLALGMISLALNISGRFNSFV